MTTCPGSALSARRATVFAASATVAVAVGADVVAGGHPWHTAALGAVAAVLAVLRVRIAEGHNGLFAAISAALLIQPVLHAATTLSPSSAETFTFGPGHAATEASVTVLHVLVAALIVTAVAGSEQLFLLVVALVRSPAGSASSGGDRCGCSLPPRPYHRRRHPQPDGRSWPTSAEGDPPCPAGPPPPDLPRSSR